MPPELSDIARLSRAANLRKQCEVHQVFGIRTVRDVTECTRHKVGQSMTSICHGRPLHSQIRRVSDITDAMAAHEPHRVHVSSSMRACYGGGPVCRATLATPGICGRTPVIRYTDAAAPVSELGPTCRNASAQRVLGVHTEARAVTHSARVTEPQRGDHAAAPAVTTQVRRPCFKNLAHADSLQGRAAMAQLLGVGWAQTPLAHQTAHGATVTKSAALELPCSTF